MAHKHKFNIPTGNERRAEPRGYFWVEYACECGQTTEKKEAK
jgi:hypothetical protein